MGPTASGKTDIAIELAQKFPFDLISVDSAQVYRDLDIGTAKPSPDVLDQTPHRLIDVREPWESYSAGDFCTDAVAAMQEITAAGRIPLLVGGTMLYFQALQQGLADLPTADPELRSRLDQRAAKEGWPALHAELQELDPVIAERLKPGDAQRIQRALEVCLLTGKRMSELQATTQPPISAEYLNIGLLPSDRAALHARIAARFAAMLDAGFVAEVAALQELPGMDARKPAMRAVGYRQFWAHAGGESALDEATEQAITATRRLAKRQHTWLRSWPDLRAVDSLADDAAAQTESIVQAWLAGSA
jgi:tRNA dimethylallyltransferase